MKKRQGFTMIELLVVIIIIAILATILFPTLVRALKKTRQSSCQNNLRLISQAMSTYQKDYGDDMEWNKNSFRHLILSPTHYGGTCLTNNQALICPENLSPFNPYGSKPPKMSLSYWFVENPKISVARAEFETTISIYLKPGDKLDDIARERRKIEKALRNFDKAVYDKIVLCDAFLMKSGRIVASRRHLRGLNVLYEDGRVKYLHKPSKIILSQLSP